MEKRVSIPFLFLFPAVSRLPLFSSACCRLLFFFSWFFVCFLNLWHSLRAWLRLWGVHLFILAWLCGSYSYQIVFKLQVKQIACSRLSLSLFLSLWTINYVFWIVYTVFFDSMHSYLFVWLSFLAANRQSMFVCQTLINFILFSIFKLQQQQQQ